MEKITDICRYLNLSANTFRESELKTNLPILFENLKKLNLIQPASPLMSVACLECDTGHFTDVILIADRFMTQCEYGSSPVSEVAKDDVNAYSFNVNNFGKWLAKQLSLNEQFKKVDGSTLFLGKKDGKSVFLLTELDYDKAIALASSINEDNKIIIWLGETPKVGFSSYKLIDLTTIIGIFNGTLSVIPDSDLFEDTPKVNILGENGIILDRHIAVTENYDLLLEFNPPVYKYSVKITPQAFKILRYLYDQRKYGVGYLSSDLAGKLGITNSRSVPTRIGELNAVCKQYKVKEVITKAPKHTWILNPDLECVKVTANLTK